MKYYFTGTLSQCLAAVEHLDKQASFVDGEKTFEISVDLISPEQYVPEVETVERDIEQPPQVEETVEPASGHFDPSVDKKDDALADALSTTDAVADSSRK